MTAAGNGRIFGFSAFIDLLSSAFERRIGGSSAGAYFLDTAVDRCSFGIPAGIYVNGSIAVNSGGIRGAVDILNGIVLNCRVIRHAAVHNILLPVGINDAAGRFSAVHYLLNARYGKIIGLAVNFLRHDRMNIAAVNNRSGGNLGCYGASGLGNKRQNADNRPILHIPYPFRYINDLIHIYPKIKIKTLAV